jgi:hypothetical protein
LEERRADNSETPRNANGQDEPVYATQLSQSANAEIALCFLRLANLDKGAFDRLGRYERALWRQVGQILLTLDVLRRAGYREKPSSSL